MLPPQKAPCHKPIRELRILPLDLKSSMVGLLVRPEMVTKETPTILVLIEPLGVPVLRHKPPSLASGS